MVLLVHDGAHAPIVGAAGDHAQVPHAKPDEVLDLAGLDVQHHRVILLYKTKATHQPT